MSKLAQRYRFWRALILLVGVALTLSALWSGYAWYADRNTGPDNLPTAEEWERIRAVEKSGSQIAPNATPGVGVVPPGSKPPQSTSDENSSSTASITPATTTDNTNEMPASETEPDTNLTDTAL